MSSWRKYYKQQLKDIATILREGGGDKDRMLQCIEEIVEPYHPPFCQNQEEMQNYPASEEYEDDDD